MRIRGTTKHIALATGTAFACLATPGCSARELDDPPQESAVTTMSALDQRFPALNDRIPRPDGRLKAVPSGFLISATAPAQRSGCGVEAHLPLTADAPMVITPADAARGVTVTRRGAGRTVARREGTVVVYDNAFRGIDALLYPSGGRLEELLVVGDAGAEIAYDVDLPAGSRLRASRPTLVEILDDTGAAWLRVRFDRAWDARGAEAEVRIETDARTIYVRLLGSPSFPVVVDPTWEHTKEMIDGRRLHAATLLKSGKVLLAGGWGTSSLHLKTAEIFDPSAQSFTSTEDMGTARHSPTATLLDSGKVLIAGGFAPPNDSRVPFTEIFDEALGDSGKFTPGPDMHVPRGWHTATRLDSGKVVILGGAAEHEDAAHPEIYEPDADMGTFTLLANDLCNRRYRHTAELLDDGRILSAGGYTVQGGGVTPHAELFDPKTGQCTPTINMLASRAAHTSTLLDNGDVLLAGGQPSDKSPGQNAAERYIVSTGEFELLDMHAGRSGHTSTALLNGWILLVGGPAEVFGPQRLDYPVSQVAGAFELTSPAPFLLPEDSHRATRLNSGDVLITGGAGQIGSSTRLAEVFSLLDDGQPCVIGGECRSGFCADSVCCNASCGGLCMACAGSKTGEADGVCAPVHAGTDPDDDCDRHATNTCRQTGACDGKGACELYPARTECDVGFVCPGLGAPCPSQCASAVECRDGLVCSAEDACVPYAVDPGSGCACTTAPVSAPRSPAVPALIVAAMFARRRRPRCPSGEGQNR